MQTFLPFPDFEKSVEALDHRRLAKQRVEAKQIYLAICDPMYGWQNHPITRMWRKYPEALAEYHNCCIREWVKRGYKNTMPLIVYDPDKLVYPSWLGNEEFHKSHRSNLLSKNPKWYRDKLGWTDPDDLPYYWVKE